MNVIKENRASGQSRVIFGMPISLFWGYVAIAIFMTGDGIELAYLSRYLFDAGYGEKEISLVFTLYALTAAIPARFRAASAKYTALKRSC